MSLDDQIVLTCAFRYALGRRTYVVDSVANQIELNADTMPLKDLDLYIREINVAIVENHAGMEMDIERWKKCRDILKIVLLRRRNAHN